MAVNYKLIRSVIKDYFKIDKNPKKGLMTLEWVMLGYMAITIITMLFTYTKLVNPEAMLWGRLRALVMTIALWAVYRMIPCRITKMVRIIAQMALLAWWYPDTYEINRMFPNLDHIFAGWEQDLFGCQPALLFAKALPWAVVSELMSMGYFMYYPMIALVSFYYFFCRYYEAERAAFVMLTSFFIYYLFYIYVPVVGPTFYFDAVGISEITKGIFPALGDYFNTHTNCLLHRWNLLPACRRRQERRRASNSSFPKFACGREHHLHAPGLAYRQQKTAIRDAAILHLPVSGYRIYSGALSYRCHRRPHLCRRHLFCIDGSIEGNDRTSHSFFTTEIQIVTYFNYNNIINE